MERSDAAQDERLYAVRLPITNLLSEYRFQNVHEWAESPACRNLVDPEPARKFTSSFEFLKDDFVHTTRRYQSRRSR